MIKDWMSTSQLRGLIVIESVDYKTKVEYDNFHQEDNMLVFKDGKLLAKINLKGSGYILYSEDEKLEDILNQYNKSKFEAIKRGDIQ